MSRWGRKNVKKAPEVVRTVTEGLKSLYRKKLLPLEQYYGFHDFHSLSLEDADFDNKPMVLVVGQYSTGKTTFIKYDFVLCKMCNFYIYLNTSSERI